MKKIAVLIMLSMFSVGALAEAWTSTYLTVKQVVTAVDYDQILVITSGGVVEVSGCSANNWIAVAGTDARLNRIYSALLNAANTGQKIKLWYKDTCGSWNYHQFSHLSIYDPSN